MPSGADRDRRRVSDAEVADAIRDLSIRCTHNVAEGRGRCTAGGAAAGSVDAMRRHSASA
jgi:hypothetical protein